MDPAIWSEMPYDLLECIASFADIDSRRALGFKPRKLPKSDLKIYTPIWYNLSLWSHDFNFCVVKNLTGKNLTGKIVFKDYNGELENNVEYLYENQIEYSTFIGPTMWDVVGGAVVGNAATTT